MKTSNIPTLESVLPLETEKESTLVAVNSTATEINPNISNNRDNTSKMDYDQPLWTVQCVLDSIIIDLASKLRPKANDLHLQETHGNRNRECLRGLNNAEGK
jgi:cob(I)alamin adenosyltransferase